MFFLMNNETERGTAVAEADSPSVPREKLLTACAQIGTSEPTALRALSGLPTRLGVRERLLAALADLGVNVVGLPAPLVTPTARGSLQLGARRGVAVPTPEKR